MDALTYIGNLGPMLNIDWCWCKRMHSVMLSSSMGSLDGPIGLGDLAEAWQRAMKREAGLGGPEGTSEPQMRDGTRVLIVMPDDEVSSLHVTSHLPVQSAAVQTTGSTISNASKVNLDATPGRLHKLSA